jgi:hypothetical protein
MSSRQQLSRIPNHNHPHRDPFTSLPRKGCLIRTQWPHLHPFSPPTQPRLPSTLQTNESHHSDRKTTRPRYQRCRASTASLVYPHHTLPSHHPPRKLSPPSLPRHLLASLSPLCHPYPHPELPRLRNREMMKGQRRGIPSRFGIGTDHAAE